MAFYNVHKSSMLMKLASNNDLISPMQFGFLPSHSTTSALLYCAHSVLALLESNSSVCGVFLDLKKAFDSVPHSPLLNLLQSLNFQPILINWLHSYLLNRSRFVLLNGATSSSRPVSSAWRPSRLNSWPSPLSPFYQWGL